MWSDPSSFFFRELHITIILQSIIVLSDLSRPETTKSAHILRYRGLLHKAVAGRGQFIGDAGLHKIVHYLHLWIPHRVRATQPQSSVLSP